MIKKLLIIFLLAGVITFVSFNNSAHAYVHVVDDDYITVTETLTFSDYFYVSIDIAPLQKIDSLSLSFGYDNINAELGTFGLHSDPMYTTDLYDINNTLIISTNTINILGGTLDDVERLNMLNYTMADVYRVVIRLNAKREYTVMGADDNPYPNRATGWQALVFSAMTVTISVDEFSNYGLWTYSWNGAYITSRFPLNEESFILSLYIPLYTGVVLSDGVNSSTINFYDVSGTLLQSLPLSDYTQYATGNRIYVDVPSTSAYVVFILYVSERLDDSSVLEKMNTSARIDINYELKRVTYLRDNTVVFTSYFNSIYLQEYTPATIPGKTFRGMYYADGVRYLNGSQIRESMIVDDQLYIYLLYEDTVTVPDPKESESNWISNLLGSIGFNSGTGYMLLWVLSIVGSVMACVHYKWSLALAGIVNIVVAGIMFFLGWLNLLYVVIAIIILVISIMMKGE